MVFISDQYKDLKDMEPNLKWTIKAEITLRAAQWW